MTDPPAPDLLLSALDHMAPDQLRLVAESYGGERRSKEGSRAQVQAALGDPQVLAQALARLDVSTRQLLGWVAERGGRSSGWRLMTLARAAALTPPTHSDLRLLYRYFHPPSYMGSAYLTPLIARGLLVPPLLPSPFLGGGPSDLPGSDSLLLPPQLVAALPSPGPGLTPDPGPLLRLTDLLRGVREVGRLPLTKAGGVARAGLRRLLGVLPAWDEAALLGWLEVARALGWLGSQSGGLEAAQTELPEAPGLAEALAGLNYTEYSKVAAPAALAASVLALLERQLRQDRPEQPLAQLLGDLQRYAPPPALAPNWRGERDSWPAEAERFLTHGLAPLGLLDRAALAQGSVRPAAGVVWAGLPETASGAAWVVQPNFEMLVYPAQLTPERLRVLGAAALLRLDPQTATYRLTRESLGAGLDSGLRLPELLGTLEAASAAPLPPALRATLDGWAARRDRLVLHTGVTLTEYPDRAARDAALPDGGTPVGEIFVLGGPLPRGAARLDPADPPPRVLRPGGGTLRLHGAPDLYARAWLPALFSGGELLPERLAQAPLPAPELLRELTARTDGPLPTGLRALLDARSTPVALGELTLFQHPQAAQLMTLPGLGGAVQAVLAPGLVVVQPGRRREVQAILAGLGLDLGGVFQTPATAPLPLNFDLDTRQKRALLEDALAQDTPVELIFLQEAQYGWYGESRKSSLHRGRAAPRRIEREGSTPYLEATWLSGPREAERFRVRVNLILGLALSPELE